MSLSKSRSVHSSPVHLKQHSTCFSPKPDHSSPVQSIHNSLPHVPLKIQISPVQSSPIQSQQTTTCSSPKPDQSTPQSQISLVHSIPFTTARQMFLSKDRSVHSPKPDHSRAVLSIQNSRPHFHLQRQISPVQSFTTARHMFLSKDR
jgi:hypothetical protein